MLGSSTAAVAVLILTGIAGASSQGYKLDVQLVARNLGSPIDLFTIPEDTSGTRYILEQDGRVLILEADNSINPLFPFLNIKDRVVSLQYAFDERGLIAVAFHPNYKENGKLYARYTANRTKANMCVDADGNTPTSPDGCPGQHSSRLSEFTVSQDNPRLVNHTSEKILMAYENPTGKNIGAGLAFGPDGLLYTGYGDGGGIYGPGSENGTAYFDASAGISSKLFPFDLLSQNLSNAYGKVHRINVDTRTGNLPYGIPETNPWANSSEYLQTIYAWGFRNPYSISFDFLYFGQNAPAPPSNGHFPFWISSSAETLFDATSLVDEPGNYGWAVKQGSHCFSRANPLLPPDLVNCTVDADCANVTVYGQKPLCGDKGVCSCITVDAEGYEMKNPAIEYVNINAAERTELVNDGLLPMPLGRASLGGYVYRGSAIRGLFGKFVNGDFGQETLNGQLYVATDPGGGSLPWPLERGFIFDKASETKAGFVKAIGQDGNGELYALTGEFDEFGQIDGRVFKIVDASITDDAPTNSTAPPTNSTAPRNNSTSAAGKHMVSWASLVTAAVIVFAM